MALLTVNFLGNDEYGIEPVSINIDSDKIKLKDPQGKSLIAAAALRWSSSATEVDVDPANAVGLLSRKPRSH
jgi:hypothetical protein